MKDPEGLGELSKLETTDRLLQRIEEGDSSAARQLYGRYRPILRSWAHGRLPRQSRDLMDTDDLVQVSLTARSCT